jgi:hypothetical protein
VRAKNGTPQNTRDSRLLNDDGADACEYKIGLHISNVFILAFKGGKWYYLHCFSKSVYLTVF